jgi:vancomycin resistance protein YoaR
MTNAPTTDPAPPVRKGPPLVVKFAIAFLMGAVLVVGAGGGALYAYGQQYTGKVLAGVRVGDTDLSGLNPKQARARLADAYASLGAGVVLVAGPTGEQMVGYAEVGRGPDLDTMVAAAMAAGRQGEPVADLLSAPQTALRGVSIPPAVTYDRERLAAAVEAVARTIDRDPVDATLVAENGTYLLTPSVDGRTVDQAALAGTLDGLLSDLGSDGQVEAEIPYTTQVPAIDTADAENAKAAAERMTADLVLTRGDSTWTIKASKLRKLISFAPTADGTITPIVDREGIPDLLKAVSTDVNRAARNATFRISNGRVVPGKASKDGKRLDREATTEAILTTMMAREAGQPDGVLAPVVVAREPTVTTAEAKKIAPKMKEISRWTTRFPIWDRNGYGANIWIPTSAINGWVVGPGEKFDFWDVVGPVTRAKGYTDGGAIINGRTEPFGALAGGICSCSTTLFNAALRAGFKMGSRKNHYYYIDRYPMGLDATVFISAGGSKQSMTWTNDTKYPVLIRGINSRSGGTGYTTFVLYSVPNKRKVVIGKPVVRNIRQASDTVQYTKSKPAGYRERIETPHDGMQVWRTVTVYEGGKVRSKKTYYSNYGVVTGVTIVGTGD